MKNTRASLRYAKAALRISLEQKKEMRLAKDMQEIVKVFSSNIALVFFLQNPIISNTNKQETILKVLTDIDPLTSQLIRLLVQNNRIDLLDQVANAYLKLLQQHQGEQVAVVTTAVSLTPALAKTVLDKAKQLSKAKITLENHINPAIIGGFILRIGDLEYNASVAHQLDQLKREFIQTKYSA